MEYLPLEAEPQQLPAYPEEEKPLEQKEENKRPTTTKTLTYLVPEKQTVVARRVEIILFFLFITLLITILILCIVFLAPQTPYDLGPTLCCSPKRMFLGQRLQNGIWYLKLDQIGTLTLYKDDPNANPALTQIWSTPTANQNVQYALLNTDGTLQLINSNGAIVYTTPLPEVGADYVVPVSPYRLILDQSGTTSIVSANGIAVWVQPPVEQK